MLNLKLAEYRYGKFERFLEMPNFLFGGDSLFFTDREFRVVLDPEYPRGQEYKASGQFYIRDKKDPLNRFNGLFDGRTYGEGRFVLIREIINKDSQRWEDEFYAEITGGMTIKLPDHPIEHYKTKTTILLGFICDRHLKPVTLYACGYYSWTNQENLFWGEYIGNIHENPELYEETESS